MEDQIPSSIPPQSNTPLPPEMPADFLEQLKARAREEAVRQTILQQQAAKLEPPSFQQVAPSAPVQQAVTQPKVIYMRRNLTVAELIVVFAVACGLVAGVQALWNFGSKALPSIEIRVK
jgi:hypothetical protein